MQYVLKLFIFLITIFSINLYCNPIPVGMEQTFTNSRIKQAVKKPTDVNTPENEAAIVFLANKIKKQYPFSKLETVTDEYGVNSKKITFRDGFWILIKVDVQVVEINTKPLSDEEYTLRKQFLQNAIWDNAKKVGLEPDRSVGGGSIHIDVNSSFANVFEFRNFFANLANHPELFSGALGIYSSEHDLPISELPMNLQDEFVSLLHQVDNKEILTIKEFAIKLQDNVYKKFKPSLVLLIGEDIKLSPPEKYHAVNVSRIVKFSDPSKWTLEIRPIRTQYSFDEFLKLTKLFTKQIHLNKGIKKPIPYNPPQHSSIFHKRQIIVDNFYSFITDVGLKWEDYRPFMFPILQERFKPSQCSIVFSSLNDETSKVIH